jgi:hypothetical protein
MRGSRPFKVIIISSFIVIDPCHDIAYRNDRLSAFIPYGKFDPALPVYSYDVPVVRQTFDIQPVIPAKLLHIGNGKHHTDTTDVKTYGFGLKPVAIVVGFTCLVQVTQIFPIESNNHAVLFSGQK